MEVVEELNLDVLLVEVQVDDFLLLFETMMMKQNSFRFYLYWPLKVSFSIHHSTLPLSHWSNDLSMLTVIEDVEHYEDLLIEHEIRFVEENFHCDSFEVLEFERPMTMDLLCSLSLLYSQFLLNFDEHRLKVRWQHFLLLYRQLLCYSLFYFDVLVKL